MTFDTARKAPDGRGPIPRLLIADDDGFVQSLLALQLNSEYDIVGGAQDADQAIELAEMHHPDVAIIDVQMPGGGGLRATREIRRLAPATAVVAISGDESDLVVRAMLQAGAITYVRKGRPGRELAGILRESIAAHAKLASE